MKKKELLAIASLLSLCACGRSESEITPTMSRQLCPLQFSLNIEPEVLPFPATRSMPSLDIPEPTPQDPGEGETPTDPGESTDELFTRIDYLVFQAEESDLLLKHKQFTSADSDFGIVYDSLPAGNYHICFLAHSDKDIAITGQTATFGTVSDTFYLFHSQAVQAGTEIEQDLDLTRIVSKIEFVSTDAVPENLKNLTMVINGYQNKIDLATGRGISLNTPYTQTYTPQPKDIGQSKLTHSFLTFIPSGEKKQETRLTAYNKEGDIIRSREIKDITPIRNRIIRYTGKLYTPSGSDETFSLHIFNEGKWDESIENELGN